MIGKVRGTVLCCLLIAIGLSLAGQEETPSLGDLARQQRERREKQSDLGAGGKAVANEGVGLRLVIPQGWKAREIPDPAEPYLRVDCAPQHPNSCWMMVKASYVSNTKTTFTEADRTQWEARKHPLYAAPTRLVASRDLKVAGYPAFEVLVRSQTPPKELIRTVYVLARDAGRLFEFSFSAAWGGKDHYAELAPAVENVIESFSPLGRAAPELSVAAIPEWLRAAARGRARLSQDAAPSGAGGPSGSAPAAGGRRDSSGSAADQKGLEGYKFSSEEQSAGITVFTIASIEDQCKKVLGKYLAWDHVLAGCETAQGWVKVSDDPRIDSNYEYRLAISEEGYEVSATPRRAGLGGYYCDGRRIYFNPRGAASKQDPVVFGD